MYACIIFYVSLYKADIRLSSCDGFLMNLLQVLQLLSAKVKPNTVSDMNYAVYIFVKRLYL